MVVRVTDEQRRLMHARDNFAAKHVNPALELLEATKAVVAAAEKKAADATAVLEELRPVWAQGWTSDSVAAQASAGALAELWKELGVDNQTAAMEALRALKAGDDL
jgi:hypothetical protein